MWHLGEQEVDDAMRKLVLPLGVECVDAFEVRKCFPTRTLKGWEMKPYAMIHCPFKDVMLLDADNIPARDPAFLFDTPQYQETGALFWPDYGRLAPDRLIWSLCGVEYRDESEFESGQMVVDKEKCWRALNLTMWYNEHSDFYYNHVYGDKETFHMAWRKLDAPYVMPQKSIEQINTLICQHDFDDNILFQHQKKWSMDICDDDQSFIHREECLRYLRQLKMAWSSEVALPNRYSGVASGEEEQRIVDEITALTYEYRLIGYGARVMTLLPDGLIGLGQGWLEDCWTLERNAANWSLVISCREGRTCVLERSEDGIWRGQWLKYEQMPIELAPTEDPRVDYDERVYTQSLPEGLDITGKPVLLSHGLTPDFSGMIEDHRERHERYCRQHGYVRLVFTERVSHHPIQWEKIARIRSLLSPNGPSHIISLDADTLINRMEVDLRNALPEFAWLGLVTKVEPWDKTTYHWDTGVMYIRNCQEARDFFDAVWRLYGRQYDPNDWADQMAINTLLFDSPHFQNGLVTLPYKWNANIISEPVHNAIVISWHGYRDPEQRRADMKDQFSMKSTKIEK
jgi:hypothetical protein